MNHCLTILFLCTSQLSVMSSGLPRVDRTNAVMCNARNVFLSGKNINFGNANTYITQPTNVKIHL